MAIVGSLIASFASAQALNVTVTPSEITGGTGSINVLITVAVERNMRGATVTLTSSHPAVASVPSSVFLPNGARSFSYTVTTVPVAKDTSVRILASVSNVPIPGSEATLRVLAPVLASFHINPGRVVGGHPPIDPTKPAVWHFVLVKGSVSLSGRAAGDMSVALSSSDPAAIVHSPLVIRANHQSADFTISTTNVSATTTAQISAQLGAKTLTGNLEIASCCW
jgi:hypothetical protein